MRSHVGGDHRPLTQAHGLGGILGAQPLGARLGKGLAYRGVIGQRLFHYGVHGVAPGLEKTGAMPTGRHGEGGWPNRP